MGLFNRKGVPAELPSLSFGVGNQGMSTRVSQEVRPVQAQAPMANNFSQPVQPINNLPANNQPLAVQPVAASQPVHQNSVPEAPLPQAKKWSNFLQNDNEPGYFKELVRNITEESEDLGKLEEWYKEKFLPGDMVFHMREYWQKQQPEMLLKNISGELKDKLMMKTEKLHQLEREWQEVYFHLMTKEDEIRKEEGELKESLSEYVEMYKRNSSDKK